MFNLNQALQDQDLGYLQIVAEFWGLELQGSAAPEARAELVAAMLDPFLAREVVATLPDEATAAFESLLAAGARLPAAQFTRQVGEIRQMGPGRRDREMPWLEPVSPAEMLWYYGLVARAFDTAATGPQEYIYIPADLAALFPARPASEETPPGVAFTTVPEAGVLRASSALVDDAATLLAWLRREGATPAPAPDRMSASLRPFLLLPDALPLTLSLLQECGCLRAPGLSLDAGVARPFLEAGRGEQLAALFKTWMVATGWNDLHQVPGLAVEGSWHNDPAASRAAVLPLLRRIPAGEWWSLESFVAAVKERQPDFQRPAGDYDSWYLRDAGTGEYLRGFEHWERVDGALIRYWLAGPLHWLGATDLAAGNEAFRLTAQGQALLAGQTPSIGEPPGRLRVHADGRLALDRSLSRYVRFQTARFAEWLAAGSDGYLYRITPASLASAGSQGVQARHVLAFLNKNAALPLPSSLEEALARWEKNGAELALSEKLVLQVKSPELLESLRRSQISGRFLGEALGPTAVEVKRQDRESLRAALVGMGMLVEEGRA